MVMGRASIHDARMKSSDLTRRSFVLRSTAGLALGAAASLPAAAGTGRSLFNGSDLAGWHKPPKRIGHGTGGHWFVKDSVLSGEQDPPGSGNGGILLSDRKFGDFDLELEMNPDWGPDSGVFFRCTEEGHGFQMYVDYHDNGNVGHLRGEMPGAFALMPFKIFGATDKTGKLTGLTTGPDPRVAKWPADVYRHICTPEAFLKVWKLNDWNHCRLKCVGKYPRVNVWINGLHLCDWDGATCTLPGYDRERVFNILGRSGSIGLQVHGGKSWPDGAQVHWRKLRVTEL